MLFNIYCGISKKNLGLINGELFLSIESCWRKFQSNTSNGFRLLDLRYRMPLWFSCQLASQEKEIFCYLFKRTKSRWKKSFSVDKERESKLYLLWQYQKGLWPFCLGVKQNPKPIPSIYSRSSVQFIWHFTRIVH